MALNDIIDQEDICASSTLTWYACFLLEEGRNLKSSSEKSLAVGIWVAGKKNLRRRRLTQKCAKFQVTTRQSRQRREINC